MGRVRGTWGVLGLLAMATWGGSPASAQPSASLEVVVKGFKGKAGQALLSVFHSEDDWLEIPKAVEIRKTPITGHTLHIKVNGLAPGEYGVSVLHDENKNNKLDMRWFPFPKPKEGAGASRDAKARMGPPKWDDAKFKVEAGKAKKLVINLTYF